MRDTLCTQCVHTMIDVISESPIQSLHYSTNRISASCRCAGRGAPLIPIKKVYTDLYRYRKTHTKKKNAHHGLRHCHRHRHRHSIHYYIQADVSALRGHQSLVFFVAEIVNKNTTAQTQLPHGLFTNVQKRVHTKTCLRLLLGQGHLQ